MQFSTGLLEGPKKKKYIGGLIEPNSTRIFSQIIKKSLWSYWETHPQLSQLIDVHLLINSDVYQSTLPRPKGFPPPMSLKRDQCCRLVDTCLPGVCRNIIMFLAFGQTKLRSSIKLKSNRRKGNEKALTVGSHQPDFYRKQDRKKGGKKSL